MRAIQAVYRDITLRTVQADVARAVFILIPPRAVHLLQSAAEVNA
jgi:hypothetical protein